MAEQWYYTRGSSRERIGPVTREELKSLASSGELEAASLVWRVGMPQWAPASSIEGLINEPAAPAPRAAARAAPSPVMPSAGAPDEATAAPRAEATIGYYSGPGRLPPRPAALLARHAPPAGHVYDWPLDDTHVFQFEHTVKMRKKISAAANLYKALFALAVSGDVVLLLVVLFALGSFSSARAR